MLHTDQQAALLAEIDAFNASRAGHIPDELGERLKQAGWLSMLLPATAGGEPPTLPDYVRLVQAIGKANGSVGWCVNQGSVLASLVRLLDSDMAGQVADSPSVSFANGPPAGPCQSILTDAGYRLSGRWNFSSGICQAEWLIAVAPTTNEGEPGPLTWHLLPKASAHIDETWAATGLRATASYAFSVEDLLVPPHHTFTFEVSPGDPPIYQFPLNLLFASGFAAVALGVARAALDSGIARVTQKIKRFDKATMAADTLTQDRVGQALATWSAADAYLHATVADAWQSTSTSGTCSEATQVALRLATTHAIREARRVTDLIYDLCSTDSIDHTQEINTRFQDMHVISQHLQAREEVYAVVARHHLGLPLASALMG